MLSLTKMNNITKSVLYGLVASAILFGIYLGTLSFVSGWQYTQNQFVTYWYFVVSLTLGFGIQIGLYQYIKSLVHHGKSMGKIVGVSGTTSTTAMISCCAHYLANLVPILGATGLVAFVTQYQTKIFWVGLLFNFGGIFYISRRIIRFKKNL